MPLFRPLPFSVRVPAGLAPLAALLAAAVLVALVPGLIGQGPPGAPERPAAPAVDGKIVEVRSGASGRLAASFAVLGRLVRKGEPLARLETEDTERALRVARARLDWLTAEALVVRARLGEDVPGELPLSLTEPFARLRQRYRDLHDLITADATYLETEALRARQMAERLEVRLAHLDRKLGEGRAPILSLAWLRHGSGRTVPPVDDPARLRAQRDATAEKLAALRARIAGAEAEARAARDRWQALLRARLQALEAERPALAQEIARLAAVLQASEICAPVSGRLVQVAPIRPGQSVPEGMVLFRIARREEWPPR